MSLIVERIRGHMLKLFPERQIYVRTGGESRYFSLKSSVQIASVTGLSLMLAVGTIAFHLASSGSTGMVPDSKSTSVVSELARKYATAQKILNEDSTAYELEIQSLKTRIKTFQAIIETERQDAKARLADLSAELAETTARFEEATRYSIEEQAQAADLEKRITQLLEDEKNAEAATSSKEETQLTELRKKRESLQKRLAAELREKEELKKRYTAKIARLQTSMTRIGEARDALTTQLRSMESARMEAETRADDLSTRLRDMQTSMASQKSRTHSLERELSGITAELSSIQLQQQSALEPVNLMGDSVAPVKQFNLEKRVADLLEIEDGLIGQLEKSAAHDLAFVEGIIRRTGLDIDVLMDSLDASYAAIGGPFLDLSDMRRVIEKTPSRPEVNDRIDTLNYQLSKLSWLEIALKTMPLATPVDNVRMTSGFGGRKDPFTRKSAFHSGLDFAGVRGTKVRTTGPGTVVFAGRRSSYGNFIEIDHGHGIHTRYAHLSSLNVEAGDNVEYLQDIGKMGSSGRSTGVHLHYEVTFNGDFKNPKQFIEAGRDVFKIQNELAEKPKKVSSGR